MLRTKTLHLAVAVLGISGLALAQGYQPSRATSASVSAGTGSFGVVDAGVVNANTLNAGTVNANTGKFGVVDAGVVYSAAGYVTTSGSASALSATGGGASLGILGVSISGATVLRDNAALGIGQYGLSLQGTAINGASAMGLQISNGTAALSSTNAEAVEFIAGPATTYNTGSERDRAYKIAWVDAAGRISSSTPATLGEAYVNATVTATDYWWTVMPSTMPFTVQRLTMRNSIAAAGTGNVVFRITDGTYNCDATVACSTFSGNATVSAALSGDCGFAPSSSLAFGVQTAGCSVIQPTLSGNVRIEGKWSPGNAPRFQYGSSIAWVGDSITKGELCYNNQAPKKLNELEPGGSVANFGRAGNTTTLIQSNWTSNVRSQGYKRLVLLGGINDVLTTSDTGATIFARLETIIDQAIADGMAVTPVTVPPANQTGAKETARTDLNTLILAKCTAAGLTCADADAALRDGSNHAILQSAYNGGDNIHLGDAGCGALATVVAGAIP